MSQPEDSSELVIQGLYEKAYEDLHQLNQQLPEEAVVSLAREVIDRLAKVRREHKAGPSDILLLAEALIGNDQTKAASVIEQHYKNGADVETLYLNYLAPAAHRLGEWWSDDKITFGDVTVGTGRIYAIMRNLSRRLRSSTLPAEKSAFFASVPHETHTLGVKMAADLSRQRGWNIDLEMGATHDELLERIEASQPLLIGLSAGGIHALPHLARLVLAIRVTAPLASILVSGNVVAEGGKSIELMNVEGVSTDFQDALEQLDEMWTVLHARMA